MTKLPKKRETTCNKRRSRSCFLRQHDGCRRSVMTHKLDLCNNMRYLIILLLFLTNSIKAECQFVKEFLDKEEWELSSKALLLAFKNPERSAEITFYMDKVLKQTTLPDHNLVRATINHYYTTNRIDRLEYLLKLASEQNICNLWKEEYLGKLSKSIYKPNCETKKPSNFSLSQQLVTMFLNDQSCRGIIPSEYTNNMSEKGYNIEYDLCLEENGVKKIDSINTERLRNILALKGIPEYSEIGYWGMQGLTTVIIHTPDLEFQEQMIDKLIASKANGNEISGQSIALIEDKISTKRTSAAIYGTQGETLIINCEHLDSLRMLKGMLKYKDYLKLTGYKDMCTSTN